ncbi:Cof-type HAD-IIB family hydrolase [Xylocopilactobacillus apicola]|uniref:Haloacid dehalogenase n=1 Tax=Xylocopilactobacillus apicola TaxID=2932184 RepID=A0AAU9DQC3_9LACO|nr:Cof-type HAD-IIB family hydrolase [Xylocopilactobacillus apicola]BDR58069.1 haloacid dehalogenase [Xylocopilactobacillus apicola]
MAKFKSIVFFDMDGTLLSSKSTIVEEVQNAVIHLKSNGNLPVIATGRAAFEVRPFMKMCNINSIISMNGQYQEYEGKIIQNLKIDPSICERILSYAEQRDDIIGFYNSQTIAISADKPLARSFYENISSPFPILNPNFYQNNLVNQILVIANHADEKYQLNFPELEFFITGAHSIDTVIKGNSKGAGIKKFIDVARLNGIPTYAFGDGINDLSMFEQVDYKIAMANGREETKGLADLITDTNDNLGIVKGLKSYNLI